MPIGDSFESFCSVGFASAGPTIWNFRESPVFWSLTWTSHADRDGVGVDGLLVDQDRAAEAFLELGDPQLEQCLVVVAAAYSGLGDGGELAAPC